jgi:hypothetical protein
VSVWMGQGPGTHGYHAFDELLHEHEVGFSPNASTVPNAATPTRTTVRGPSVSLFIHPYWNKGDIAGILEKFNPVRASSVTRHTS